MDTSVTVCVRDSKIATPKCTHDVILSFAFSGDFGWFVWWSGDVPIRPIMFEEIIGTALGPR